MNTIPLLSEQALRDRIGERSFQRGLQYFRNGAIFDARRQGMLLKAHCTGSRPEPYRVWARFDANGIAEAQCSCPVGAGGYCKHAAALLLSWQAAPETFIEQEDVDTALECRSKAELIALIKQMLLRRPELDVLLETPLPTPGKQRTPVRPEVYRRQAESILQRGGYEWGVEAGIAEELRAIMAIGDGFADQQDYASAAAVYEAVATAVLERYELFQDEEGALVAVISECADGLIRCLVGGREDMGAREAMLTALFEIFQLDMEYGGYGFSDKALDGILEHATAEERRTIAGWVRDALPAGGDWSANFRRKAYGAFLLDLEAETLDDEAYLRICRETGLTYGLIDRLLTLDRLDEAIAEIERAERGEFIELVDLLVAHGHGDEAERLMRERSGTTEDWRVLDWLKSRYKARGDAAAALEVAEKAFERSPSLAGYQEIRQLAGSLGRWDSLRPAVLTMLERPGYSSLLIESYLLEGEIDRALNALKTAPPSGYGYFGGYSLRLKVAEAAEETWPRATLEIYRQYAEGLIAQRGRENYRQACDLLRRVRRLYQRLGENETWTCYIAELREQNRTLRALKEELAAAEL
ncbi:SWIM zinc finger family protein [Nitrolancea hollandica]|uniref:SWIM-type domain-containing protein n=1 Tax=Nitrolancea hollandica Lb TaxID=1129897 RepID=I4EI09_9BACT|nr:SWIM zinc finger family protein [Nitrolancea hollandica]CCF84321.1 hypothetical protein NITHO_3310038 [Nitrolancea hollandica Lb]